MTLAQARAARDDARRSVLAAIDPAEVRRDANFALLAAHQNSFEAVARPWHKVWTVGKHARYVEDVIGRLERNVVPNIGHKPVAQIEAKDIVRMMEGIQGRGANDIAKRVRNTCSQIFSFAGRRRVYVRQNGAHVRGVTLPPKENISVNAVSPDPVEIEFTRTYIDSQRGYREYGWRRFRSGGGGAPR